MTRRQHQQLRRPGEATVTANGIAVAQVYGSPNTQRGYRVLVDRIWPRGLSKAQASLDEWCRDIAPTTALRRWYGHRPERFAEFRRRYLTELDDRERAEALAKLNALARQGDLTLLTATKDLTLSAAVVLAERLTVARDADRSATDPGPASTRKDSGTSHG